MVINQIKEEKNILQNRTIQGYPPANRTKDKIVSRWLGLTGKGKKRKIYHHKKLNQMLILAICPQAEITEN